MNNSILLYIIIWLAGYPRDAAAGTLWLNFLASDFFLLYVFHDYNFTDDENFRLK